MRGTPRESSTMLNMVDGVFAVAITLVPASLPNVLPTVGGASFVLTNLSIILIAVTMLLLWYKIRNLVQLKSRLTSTEMGLLGTILTVVVMIPKSAYISIHYGAGQGSIWMWSDSQWVDFQYQILFLLVDAATFILTIRTLRSSSLGNYPQEVRRWLLGVEALGLIIFIAIILAENLFVSINGIFVFLAPAVLFMEEFLCFLKLRHFSAESKARQ
jgi:hypothetical protein